MNEEQREEFGSYLRALRDARGLTQRQVAAMAGISSPYLAQLERGQRNPPSREVLAKLARVYHVSEQKLLQAASYEAGGNVAVSPERIEWAFEALRRDPNYSYGTRMEGHELTLEAKAFIVELYQESTGRQLLTGSETDALKEFTR